LYAIDPRLRGLPAKREQVVSLQQSLNQPHLAIPGMRAGPAQAYIVGLRGSAGLSVFVYLFLPEIGECAVYVSERRNLGAGEFAAEEQEAVSFTESMGFMMDQVNFRALPAERQEELLRTLPVFLKDPRLVPRAPAARKEPQASPLEKLGRLFAAF
jgi:hypothetical protein